MERRESQEYQQLRKSEELCKTLAETARVCIHYYTVEGIITYLNPFAEEISGYTRDEIIGKNFLDVLVPPDLREQVVRDIQNVFAGFPVENYKAPMVTKSGELRIMLWSGARVLNPDGTASGVVVSGIDVTEFEHVQDELRESERLYKTLVDYDLAALMIVDETGLLFMSRRSEELTGYTHSEIKTKPMWHLVHPDDRERVKQLVQETMVGGRPSEVEGFRLVGKSGDTLEMFGRGMPISYEGKQSLLVSAIDVTPLKQVQNALRESEELYRTLVDNSLAAVVIIRNNRFLFVNKISEEIMGYSTDELLSGDVTQFVHPDDRQMLLDRSVRRIRGEEVPSRYEFRVITKAGEIRWLEVHATLISYQGKDAILANIVDSTERRRMEEARVQSQVELALHKQKLYAEAINALTNGKLDVVEPETAALAMEDPRITVELNEPADASLARHMVKEFAAEIVIDGGRLDDFLLAVGEATVNTLKHAGKGRLKAGTREGKLWVGVIDEGPGMDTFVLTRAVLGRGFSTKPSLGFGYTFILNGSDHVELATSPKGTAVMMELNIVPKPAYPLNLGRIPDLWQSP